MANDDDWIPRYVDPDCIREGTDARDGADIKTVEELAEVGDEDAIAVAVAESRVRPEEDDDA